MNLINYKLIDFRSQNYVRNCTLFIPHYRTLILVDVFCLMIMVYCKLMLMTFDW